MARRRTPTNHVALISTVLAIVGFVGGMAFNAFTIASSIAPKSYVDEGLAAGRKYTDDKSSQVLKEAIAHSDANRQAMVTQITEIAGGIRADVKELRAQNTFIIDTLHRIQTDGIPPRRK